MKNDDEVVIKLTRDQRNNLVVALKSDLTNMEGKEGLKKWYDRELELLNIIEKL